MKFVKIYNQKQPVFQPYLKRLLNVRKNIDVYHHYAYMYAPCLR